jgi:hypothetical protein
MFTNFKKTNKIKNNYEKISIVTLALLMTVGTFYKLESLKKHKTQEVQELEQSVAQ